MDCTKCDDRGMIADENIKGAAHSCSCGKANRLMEARFKGASIADLVNYLNARHSYKERSHE